jgi:hypothetical protein
MYRPSLAATFKVAAQILLCLLTFYVGTTLPVPLSILVGSLALASVIVAFGIAHVAFDVGSFHSASRAVRISGLGVWFLMAGSAWPISPPIALGMIFIGIMLAEH